MKRLVYGLALVAAALVAGPQAHAQFTLVKSVVGNGGGPMGNSTFSINGTVGQPAIGLVANTTIAHGIGFWYPAVLPTGSVALPGYTAGGHMLEQNFPNPFKGSTTIRFSLAKRANVTLKVFSAPGEEIATLTEGTLEAGVHSATLDAKELPSGTYFYQLQVDNLMLRRQMVATQ